MFLKIILNSPARQFKHSGVICCVQPIQIPLAVTVYDRRTAGGKFCHYIHHNLDSQTLPFSLAVDVGKPLKMWRINGKSKVIYYWAFGPAAPMGNLFI